MSEDALLSGDESYVYQFHDNSGDSSHVTEAGSVAAQDANRYI